MRRGRIQIDEGGGGRSGGLSSRDLPVFSFLFFFCFLFGAVPSRGCQRRSGVEGGWAVGRGRFAFPGLY